MNTTLSSIIFSGGLVLASASLAASHVDVYLSGNLNPTALQEFAEYQEPLLFESPPGTVIRFIEADAWTVLAEVTIPKVKNPRGRLKAMSSELVGLAEWLRDEIEANTASARGTLDIAEALTRSGESAQRPDVILLVGNPVFRTNEPGFSFVDPEETDLVKRFRRPSHMYLRESTRYSPFGTKGQEGSLEGVNVHLWDPINEVASSRNPFERGLRDFWVLSVELRGGRMLQYGSDGRTILKSLLRDSERPLQAKLKLTEDKLVMLSSSREGGSHVITPSLPAISDYWVIDATASMGPYRERAARFVSSATVSPAHHHAVILFTDYDVSERTSYLFSENSNPAEIVEAMRAIPLSAGSTTKESLADGLALAQETLGKRKKSGKSRFWIITDAPPHPPSMQPSGNDYRAIVSNLLGQGHHVTVFRLHEKHDLSWVPAGVAIRNLP